MEGLTLTQGFGSGEFGLAFPLHLEDFELPALNFLQIGSPTWWLTVAKKDLQNLLDILDRNGAAPRTGSSDQQYLRHTSIFVLPRYLEQNQIPYNCFLQPQAYGVLLFQGTCHEGFRCGPNMAEAANYYPPGWVPPIIRGCNSACNGREPITRRHRFKPPQCPPCHDFPLVHDAHGLVPAVAASQGVVNSTSLYAIG